MSKWQFLIIGQNLTLFRNGAFFLGTLKPGISGKGKFLSNNMDSSIQFTLLLSKSTATELEKMPKMAKNSSRIFSE